MKTILAHLAEGRRLATQPLPQDRQPALHGACHRGDGRVRPVWTSRTLRRSLRRTERRRSCATRRCASSLASQEAHTSTRSTGATTTWAWSSGAATSCEGNYCYRSQLHEQHERFAKTWDNNLRLQGFAEVFTDKCILG